MTSLQPSADPSINPSEHAPSTLGVRRFFHANETLIKIISLVFAAAGILRAQPHDDAIAVMQCLFLILGLIMFVRLWEDLPRRYGVLPGEGWTLGLIVVYYCLTILLVVSNFYLMSTFVAQRYRYLWVALGTLLAVAGASALTYWSTAGHPIAGARVLLVSTDKENQRFGVLIAVLLVAIIAGSYLLARVVSPALNAGLDQVFGAPP